MKKKSPQDSNSTGQEESSSLVSFCRSSVAAGVCIGCAGLIYSRLIGTALGGYVGALCFAAGLYYVVLKGLTLYTGRIDPARIEDVIHYFEEKLQQNPAVGAMVKYLQDNAQDLIGKNSKEIFAELPEDLYNILHKKR